MDYMTLDDQATLAAIESDSHGFIRGLGSKKIVLDEFQYAPSLIPAIKEAFDRLSAVENGKFLLTGSTDIFRSAKVQEALPGHMIRLELHPLSISELTEQPRNIVDFLVAQDYQLTQTQQIDREKIAEFILAGGYPEPQTKSRRAKRAWFNSYMEGRLYKDFESLYTARGDHHSKLQALAPYLAC